MRTNDEVRKVLVHAANGVQGSAIARALHEEGFEVRACVRDRAKASGLAATMEVVQADLDDHVALAAANRGMDAVVLTVPLSWDRATLLRWTRHAAEAALDARVRLCVLNLGTRLPDTPTALAAYELRRECESVARSFGPASISLRPPLFMENLLAPWIMGAVQRDRVLPYPLAARMRVSWLSVADLGGYAAAALRRPDLAGMTFDIGGPAALDGVALAEALSTGSDRPVTYCVLSPEQVEQQLAPLFGADVARGIAQNYAWMARRSDSDFLSGTSDVLTRELRRPLRTVREWARKLQG